MSLRIVRCGVLHHRYHEDIVRPSRSIRLACRQFLVVHGLWLNRKEVDKLNEKGCFFAHNPRSNMNNHVGYCQELGNVKNLVIGTDGFGGNMFEELKLAFFQNKDARWPLVAWGFHPRRYERESDS